MMLSIRSTILVFIIPLQIFSQSFSNETNLIINEIGFIQGTQQAFIELIVINDAETSLSGWMIDNYSDENTLEDDGYIQFSNDFPTLATGSTILIYNDDEIAQSIDASFDGQLTQDGFLQLPFSSPLLEKVTIDGRGSNTNWGNYLSVNNSHNGISVTNPSGQPRTRITWGVQGLTPNGTFLSNATLGAISPTTSSLAIGSSCLITSPPENESGYEAGFTMAQPTPGKYNNYSNQYNIQTIQSGNFSLLSFSISCSQTSASEPNQATGSFEVLITGGQEPFNANVDGPAGSNPIISIEDQKIIVSGLISGNYIISVTDKAECNQSCEVFISEITNQLTFCEGENIIIGRDLEGTECGFKWIPETGLTTPENSVTGAAPEPGEEVVYQLITSDGNGSIVDIEEYIVLVNANPNINIDPSPAYICAEDITLEVEQGFLSYAWNSPISTTSPLNQNSLVIQKSEINASGQDLPLEYAVIVTDDNNCSEVANSSIYDLDEFEQFLSFMEADGYSKIIVDNIINEIYVNETDVFTENARVSIELNSELINVNEDIGDFLTVLAAQVSSVKGIVDFVSESSYSCNDLPLLLNDISGSRSVDDEYLFKMHAIGIKKNNGQDFLLVKFGESRSPLQEVIPKTLYILPMSDTNVDNTFLRQWINYYFLQLECTVADPADCLDINLNIEVVNSIDQENVFAGDALSIIGENKSKIIDLATGSYCELYDPSTENTVIQWLDNDLSVEAGVAFGKQILSLIDVSLISNYQIDRFKAQTAEEVIGFFVFHATGHNAGMTHNKGNSPTDKKYMHFGPCLPWELGAWPSTCHSFPNPSPHNSLTELIHVTPDFIKIEHRKRFE